MNSKKGIALGGLVVLALIVGSFFLFRSTPAPDTQPVGNALQPTGQVHLQTESFTQGLLATEIQLGAIGNGAIEGFVNLPIAAGSNQTCAKLPPGTYMFDKGFFGLSSGTASSSYAGFLFASSSASIPTSNNFTNLAPSVANTVLSGVVIATSSVATSTASAIPNTVATSSTVAAPVYVCAYMQQKSTLCGAGTGMCESATSTARGFNPYGLIHYYRF